MNIHTMVIGFIITIGIATQCNPFTKTEKDENENILGLALLDSANKSQQAQILESNKKAFIETYAKIAFQNYSDSYSAAVEFQTAVNTFVNNTGRTDADLKSLKTKWREVRIPYLQTEVFRFSSGPIDNKALTDNVELEPLINAWPLDEGHNDGIIAKGGFTKESLISANEGTCIGTCPNADEGKNISVGWHAIEYILWGKDPENNSGPGERPFSDFGTSSPNASGTTQEKNLAYLKIATDILVEHIGKIKDKWDSEKEGNYRTGFVSDPNKSLDLVLRGMARFAGGEWGGERMTGVFEGDQEEEHSCFSDNTKHDFYYDAVGFENLFTGTYKGEKIGTGLESIFGDETSQVKADLQTSKRFCLNEFDESPDKNPTCSDDVIASRFDKMIYSLGDGANRGTERENQDYKIFRNEIQPAVQRIAKSFQKAAGNMGVNIGNDGLVLEE